jgi:hypothetical protein
MHISLASAGIAYGILTMISEKPALKRLQRSCFDWTLHSRGMRKYQ